MFLTEKGFCQACIILLNTKLMWGRKALSVRWPTSALCLGVEVFKQLPVRVSGSSARRLQSISYYFQIGKRHHSTSCTNSVSLWTTKGRGHSFSLNFIKNFKISFAPTFNIRGRELLQQEAGRRVAIPVGATSLASDSQREFYKAHVEVFLRLLSFLLS